MPLKGKDEMLHALLDAGVDVPASASISQLRTLYAEVLGQPPVTEQSLSITAQSSSTTVQSINATTQTVTSSTAATVTTCSTHATARLATSCADSVKQTNESGGIINEAYNTMPAVHGVGATLARQIQVLQQQKELLLLQQEVKELQRAVAPAPVFDAGHIDSMVNCFSGDDHYDVNKWVCDLEDAFETLQLDERSKFVAARRLLTGTAKVFLRTVSTFQYSELKALLLSEFGHVYSTQEVYTLLRNRRLRPNESTKRYVIEMQEIASRANIPEIELVEFVIGGISHTNNDVSILYTATNLNGLKRLLERYERIRTRTAPRIATNMRSTTMIPAAVNLPTLSDSVIANSGTIQLEIAQSMVTSKVSVRSQSARSAPVLNVVG